MADKGGATATETSKKKVMVAIDESESSEQALIWALENLRPEFRLVIYTAQLPFDVSSQYSSMGYAELIKELEESQRKRALASLEKAKTICSKFGVVPEVLTEVGEPKLAICNAVEKLNVQLLVIGSQGLFGFESSFLGSVSNYCVHHAKCPVVVVRKTG